MLPSPLSFILLLWCAVFGALFQLQRLAWRRRRRKRLDPGFYPSTRELGNSLQTLQSLGEPRVVYVLQEKRNEPAEDEESGDGGPKV